MTIYLIQFNTFKISSFFREILWHRNNFSCNQLFIDRSKDNMIKLIGNFQSIHSMSDSGNIYIIAKSIRVSAIADPIHFSTRCSISIYKIRLPLYGLNWCKNSLSICKKHLSPSFKLQSTPAKTAKVPCLCVKTKRIFSLPVCSTVMTFAWI